MAGVKWLLFAFQYSLFTIGDGDITKNTMDLFLEQLGAHLINQRPNNPMQYVRVMEENMQISYKSIVQIADIACQLSLENEQHPALTYYAIDLIKAGCRFIEDISSNFLQFMGNKLDEEGEQHLGGITSISFIIWANAEVTYAQSQAMFPLVCKNAKAEVFTPTVFRPMLSAHSGSTLIKKACSFLERISVEFLERFSQDEIFNDPAMLHIALSQKSKILTKHRRCITYGQVSMMLPYICEGQLGNRYVQSDIEPACGFFKNTVVRMLEEVSAILTDPLIIDKSKEISTYNDGMIITKRNKKYRKGLQFHETKPFIYDVCAKNGINWDWNAPNWWATPACEYFLRNHMEAMVK